MNSVKEEYERLSTHNACCSVPFNSIKKRHSSSGFCLRNGMNAIFLSGEIYGLATNSISLFALNNSSAVSMQ